MVAIFTLVFLLSREQSSVVMRRSSSDGPPQSKRSVPVAKETHDVPLRPEPDRSPSVTSVKPPEPPIATKPLTEKPPLVPPVARSNQVADTPAQTVPTPAPSTHVSEGPLAGLSVDGPVGSDGPLVLDLEATELSWVVVQIDAGSHQEALLRPGEKAQWKAQDQFTITLGNAGGVHAELNGKPQRAFGPSGKVVRDVVLKR